MPSILQRDFAQPVGQQVQAEDERGDGDAGKDRHPGREGGHGLATEQEDIRILPMAADDALALLADGRIQNAITLIALQWFALNRQSLRRRWAPLEATDSAL